MILIKLILVKSEFKRK